MKGARLPEDWQPQAELIAWAQQRFPNVDVQLETEKFIDYWLSKAGSGALKTDWDRTFRNWIRNAHGYSRVVPIQRKPAFDRDENRARIVQGAAGIRQRTGSDPFD